MDMSTALTTDLAALTAALGSPGTDLGVLLGDLSRTVRVAVSSCIGLRLTAVNEGSAITLGTLPAGAPVVASLRLPLDAVAPVEPGGMVTFFATNAGAFVDLAADLDHALGGAFAVLDDDLAAAHLPPGIHGLDDMSAVNRAIGYLIGGGWTPAEAEAELDRRAAHAGLSRPAAARRVFTLGGPTSA